MILLYFVTFGIYGLYWYYVTHDEMKRETGEGLGGGVALLIAFFVGVVMPFITANEVGRMYEKAGRTKPVSAATGLWVIRLPDHRRPVHLDRQGPGALNRYSGGPARRVVSRGRTPAGGRGSAQPGGRRSGRLRYGRAAAGAAGIATAGGRRSGRLRYGFAPSGGGGCESARQRNGLGCGRGRLLGSAGFSSGAGGVSSRKTSSSGSPASRRSN